jgi:hypothetical protein
MMANSYRLFASQSGVAPASSRTTVPVMEGSGVAIAGRSMPLIRRRVNRETATAAPVLAIVTRPSALAFLTSWAATMTEASGFCLNASTGCSVISMICLAGTISTLWGCGRACASSGSNTVGSPMSRKWAWERRAASITPCATTCGPLSPPMASTAIRILFRLVGSHRP